MLPKVRRNPLHESIRRAVDALTFALCAHDIFVNEFTHPDGRRGVEYIAGGKVVAGRDDDGPTMMFAPTDLDTTQVCLIESHARAFPAFQPR